MLAHYLMDSAALVFPVEIKLIAGATTTDVIVVVHRFINITIFIIKCVIELGLVTTRGASIDTYEIERINARR